MLMIKEKSKNLRVCIIKDDIKDYIPSDYKIRKWAKNSYEKIKTATVVIKITSVSSMREINSKFLNNKKACNVLSFPNISKNKQISDDLGDIVICAKIVNKESRDYLKKNDNRWAHMITHSMLHLQGYKHSKKKERDVMEEKEIKLMNKLGLSNPYYAE